MVRGEAGIARQRQVRGRGESGLFGILPRYVPIHEERPYILCSGSDTGKVRLARFRTLLSERQLLDSGVLASQRTATVQLRGWIVQRLLWR
jgi:hypothetical protein